MTNTLSKRLKGRRGFTIVELLIVIVVIGILAAITMVSYNGIQNRSKTAAGQQLANSVAKKAQAYYTIKSSWPTAVSGATGFDAEPESALDNPSSVIVAADGTAAGFTGFDGDDANGGKVVVYRADNGKVYYWDYTDGSKKSVN